MKISHKRLHEIIAEEVTTAIASRKSTRMHMSLVALLEDAHMPNEHGLESIIFDNILRSLEKVGISNAREATSKISDVFISYARVALTTGDTDAIRQAIRLGREEAIDQVGIDKLQGLLSVSDALRAVTALDDIEIGIVSSLGMHQQPADVDHTIAEAPIGDGGPNLKDIAIAVTDIENLEKSNFEVGERLDKLSDGLSTLMKKMKTLSQSVEAEKISADVEDIKSAIDGD